MFSRGGDTVSQSNGAGSMRYNMRGASDNIEMLEGFETGSCGFDGLVSDLISKKPAGGVHLLSQHD